MAWYDKILDDDLLACTGSDGVTYNVSGDRFKSLLRSGVERVTDYYLLSPGVAHIRDGSGSITDSLNYLHHHRPNLDTDIATFIGLTEALDEHEDPISRLMVDKNSFGFGHVGDTFNAQYTTWHPGITKKEINLSPIFDIDNIIAINVLDIVDEVSIEYENIDPVMYKFDGSLKTTFNEFYEKTGMAIFYDLNDDPIVEGNPEYSENYLPDGNFSQLPAGTAVTGVEPGTWISYDLFYLENNNSLKPWIFIYVDSDMKVQYVENNLIPGTRLYHDIWGDILVSNSFPALSTVDNWSLTYLKDPSTEPLFELLGDQKSFRLQRDMTDLKNYMADWVADNPGATDEEKLLAFWVYSGANKYNYEKNLVKLTIND